MSGPKRSSWSLGSAIGRMVSRHIAEQAHRAKITQLENAIEDCRDQLEDLEAEYGEYAAYVVQRAGVWLDQAENSLNGDLRYGWRQVNGARSYIANQASRLAEKRAQFVQRQQYRQEQARRHQEAIRRQQDARSRYEEERRRREQARQRQADDIVGQISDLREELKGLQSEYGAFAANPVARVGQWLNETEECLSTGNLAEARRSLSGSRQYLDRQIEIMVRKQERARHEQERRAHPRKPVQPPVPLPEEVHEPTEAERLYDGLNLLLQEHPEVVNEGVKQNVALIGQSLEIAPDNPNTLASLTRLFDRVQDMVEKAEQRQKEREYARRVFAEIIAGSGGSGLGGSSDDGEGGLSGVVDGMPVSVEFDEKSTEILLHTPENSGCKQHLSALSAKLAEKGVALGPVNIRKTGENWNPVKTSNYVYDKRVNA